MRVLVQWTRSDPDDWQEIDAADWPHLPGRSVPAEGQLGGDDDLPGWVHRLNVQGIQFIGDHYAVEHLGPDRCRVTAWFDDPDSYPPDQWQAIQVTFNPPRRDPQLGGAWNTDQDIVVFAAPGSHWWAMAGLSEHRVRPWVEFHPPALSVTRHGIWVTDELNAAHEARLSARGVREWIPDLGVRPDGSRIPLGPQPPGADLP